MALNTEPIFGNAPQITISLLTAAMGGTLTAPTNIVAGFTAGSDGAIVRDINFAAQVATTAGKVYIFLEDTAASGTYYFQDYVPVPASGALSATVNPFEQKYGRSIKLKAGWKLWYAMHNAEALCVTSYADSYTA
jgi:hypothetical protein